MKLISARITNFRSIEDSGEFRIDELTCLVGKNEAGKTAALHSLYGIRPQGEFSYDPLRDYPRRFYRKYSELYEDGASEVVTTAWELSDSEIKSIKNVFGNECLKSNIFKVTSYMGSNKRTYSVPINEKKSAQHLVSQSSISQEVISKIGDFDNTQELAGTIENIEERDERTEALLALLKTFRNNSAYLKMIDIIDEMIPSFFYTSHYERMSGEISVKQLIQDKKDNKLSSGDKIFLDFLEYAGTSVEELQDAKKHEELIAQCEAASNDITDEIFQFWSQNEALRVRIEINEGKPEDPAPFNSGPVVKIRIYNDNHRVSVPLSERSAGFVWFFSFLSQFKQLKNQAGNAILLLDEPGLTLHGKAQSDLLKYIQERLLPEHQVIYSTHSPFMIPCERLSDVRVVEDVVKHLERGKVAVEGTKISEDVLTVDKDTIFPLQGHLGYEITQSLFIGKNTLLVEGPSDILYLTTMSNILKSIKREGLNSNWTLCPSGGIDKISSFASLFGGNRINIAVLSDFGSGDKNKLEKLKTSQLLNSQQIFTICDFIDQTEADIEDLFGNEIYINIINSAYSLKQKDKITKAKLSEDGIKNQRIVKAVEACFRLMPESIPEFDHYTPSYWLMQNTDILKSNDELYNHILNIFENIFKTYNALLQRI